MTGFAKPWFYKFLSPLPSLAVEHVFFISYFILLLTEYLLNTQHSAVDILS